MLLFTAPRRDLKLGLFAPRALDVNIVCLLQFKAGVPDGNTCLY